MDQDELQYDEGVEGGEGGEESFAAAGEDDHQLNDTDQSIETELEAIKGTLQPIYNTGHISGILATILCKFS